MNFSANKRHTVIEGALLECASLASQYFLSKSKGSQLPVYKDPFHKLLNFLTFLKMNINQLVNNENLKTPFYAIKLNPNPPMHSSQPFYNPTTLSTASSSFNAVYKPDDSVESRLARIQAACKKYQGLKQEDKKTLIHVKGRRKGFASSYGNYKSRYQPNSKSPT